MELLNNIWNALTTRNEYLVNILSIPFTIIETILLMSLFLSILDIQNSSRYFEIALCLWELLLEYKSLYYGVLCSEMTSTVTPPSNMREMVSHFIAGSTEI